MLEMDMGKQGAKRSRYFPNSPDAVLRKVIEGNPDCTETQLEEIFEEQVRKYDGEILSAIIAYWFANRYRALMKESMPVSVRRERKVVVEKHLAERVKEVKKATVAVIARTLLDKISPATGKAVRDMTKEDCQKEGGWFLSLAKRLKPKQRVSQAKITDEELWGIYNS